MREVRRVLVEEAVEKLSQARDTIDESERIELIDEVINALEEGKIETAEKKKKLRLVASKTLGDLAREPEIEIKGKPIIVPFPAYGEESVDWVAIFEVVEE